MTFPSSKKNQTSDIRHPASGTFLPYAAPSLDEDDIKTVSDVLNSGWLTTGPKVEQFENALSEYLHAKNTVVCNSGTAALHLAAHSFSIGPGSVVIVPSVSFVATANAFLLNGADVVFADVDPDNGLMQPAHIEDAIARCEGRNLRAIVPVHLAGQCADPEGIWQLAQHHNLCVIEDACHAIGSAYGTHKVGECAHSNAACFSFHAVKNIAVGEGGAVCFNTPEAADKARSGRSHGMIKTPTDDNPHHSEMHHLMPNYRLNDISCALGISQLKKLDRFIAHRQKLVQAYDEALGHLDGLTPISKQKKQHPAWHLYGILLQNADKRTDIINALLKENIGTQIHYPIIPHQPYYVARYGHAHYPGAESYTARTLSLPLHCAMDEDDVDRIVKAIRAIL